MNSVAVTDARTVVVNKAPLSMPVELTTLGTMARM